MENEEMPKTTESYLLSMIRADFNLQLLFFLIIWLLSMVIAGLIVQGIGASFGIEFKTIVNDIKNGSITNLNAFKFAQVASHLLQYLLPSMLFVGLLYPKRIKEYLYVDNLPKIKTILLGLFLIISIYPFISFVYYWNTQLLPDEAISKDILEMQRILLKMESPFDLGLNLLLFGFVAGLGEEVLFRGIIQRIITKKSQNIYIGAILTGFLFSVMHFQLEGFIPRMILGIFLSYLLVITGNLWITIIIHVFFNSFQVIIPYFYPHFAQNIQHVEQVSPFLALISIVIFIGTMIFFVRNNKENKHIYINSIKLF